MKQFFKFMFASMLGTFLSLMILFFISMMIIAGMVYSLKDESKAKVEKNSVLEIRLDGNIKEHGSDQTFPKINPFTQDIETSLGLNQILSSIKRASSDENIKGIFLNLEQIDAGMATITEIRNALIEFKKSKKFITAYSEFYSQKAYYLASVADKININPEGYLDFRGLRANPMFYKGTLEKLDVEAQIIRHGKYKSFAEPFFLDKMSKENREQIGEMISTIWDEMLGNISASRNISVDELKNISGNLLIRKAEDAVKYKLADEVAFYDEVEKDLKKSCGTEDKTKLKSISLAKYVKGSGGQTYSKNKIAVIYAVGGISGGEGDEDNIGSETISDAIRKARLDTAVKAIVLRVNSPGGSALASDVIWREATLAKKAKPFVVSMGDVAASGGYYISCAADTIVAQPNTITGSIGVIGIVLNTQKFFSNKLGITFDTVKTGRFSDFGSQTRPLTAEEKRIGENEVERIYTEFVSHVADGRHMKASDVDSIGQGRVWSGVDAKKIGLVDVLGGLDDAIGIAARMAKVGTYRIISLPEQKDLLQRILENISADTKVKNVRETLGDAYPYYIQMKHILNMRGMQARMPMEIVIE
ncbi:MAG: signal peptide peptidase SppA [Bacteroidia bacterium]|nr:signal peptide peptidase SppA [Bacteroidia bacterium]